MQPPAPRVLLNALNSIAAGALFPLATPNTNPQQSAVPQTKHAFEASLTGTSPTATVNIEVCNDPTQGWVVASTMTLGGANPLAAGQVLDTSWLYVRGNVTALTGAGAAVTLTVAP